MALCHIFEHCVVTGQCLTHGVAVVLEQLRAALHVAEEERDGALREIRHGSQCRRRDDPRQDRGRGARSISDGRPTQREHLLGRLSGVDITESVAIGPLSDEDLVARAAGGDVSAFEALVAPRLDRSVRTASAILGREADAHDVVQEAFVATWRHLPKLRDRTKFDAWLSKMIVNRCRDALRRRHRSPEVALDVALNLHSEDESDAAAGMAALTTAFERLSIDHRHLLVMHHLHRVPVANLARELGIPEGTAKWRLHAARAALTRALEMDR